MCVATKLLLVTIFWIALQDLTPSTALKDVHLILPNYVKSGDGAVLTCNYNLEQDTLYAIIWYKDDREFYRFTPKDPSHVKKFILRNDIDIDISGSIANTMMLSTLRRSGSGVYTCMVETGAPEFHLEMDSVRLEVVDVPETEPEIHTDDRVYNEGDFFEANCTINSPPSLVNLTWLINGQELLMNKQTGNLGNTDLTEAETHPKEVNRLMVGRIIATIDRYRVTLYLKLMLQSKHFISKKLTLECRAKTFDIHEITTQQIIRLDSTSNQVFVFVPLKSTEHKILNSNEVMYKERNRRSIKERTGEPIINSNFVRKYRKLVCYVLAVLMVIGVVVCKKCCFQKKSANVGAANIYSPEGGQLVIQNESQQIPPVECSAVNHDEKSNELEKTFPL